MNNAKALARKYGPVIYWLIFACLTAVGGTDPGYIPRSMPLPSYPVPVVVIIWLIFAALIRWHLSLLSPNAEPGLARKAEIAAYIALLLLLIFPITGTDKDGLTVVVGLFAFCNLALLVGYGLSSVLSPLFGQGRKAP